MNKYLLWYIIGIILLSMGILFFVYGDYFKEYVIIAFFILFSVFITKNIKISVIYKLGLIVGIISLVVSSFALIFLFGFTEWTGDFGIIFVLMAITGTAVGGMTIFGSYLVKQGKLEIGGILLIIFSVLSFPTVGFLFMFYIIFQFPELLQKFGLLSTDFILGASETSLITILGVSFLPLLGIIAGIMALRSKS